MDGVKRHHQFGKLKVALMPSTLFYFLHKEKDTLMWKKILYFILFGKLKVA